MTPASSGVAPPALIVRNAIARTRQVDAFLLLPLATASVLLLAGNEDFGFDPAGWLDPFMYFGYFWHYPDQVWGVAHDYKASRLPWIVPGYLIHTVADPVAASYALVFTTLSSGGVAVYLLLRDITGDRSAAAVVAVAWTACTWVHGIGGWNYHMLAAADYFLIGTWLSLRSARTHSRAAAVWSGVCIAAAVHTHLFFAAFVPLVALTYWSGFSVGEPFLRQAHADAWRGVAGALGLTLVLAAVNVAAGGGWLFFMFQLDRARQLEAYDDWWVDAARWLPHASYLIVPAVLMTLALARVRAGDDENDRRARVLVLQAWLALGIMSAPQFILQQATLNEGYLAFPLYVYAFACGGVVLASRQREGRIVTTVAMAAVILAPLLLLMPTLLPRAMDAAAAAVAGPAAATALPALAFAALGAAAIALAPRTARLWLFAGWFGVLNAWIAPAPSAYGIDTPGYRRQMLRSFHEADGMTSAFDPSLDGIKYWFRDERVDVHGVDLSLGWVFDSYVSTRGWQANLLVPDRTVPLQQLTLNDLDRAVCVGLLTSPQTARQLESDFRSHFAALGRPLRRVSTRRLRQPDLSFDLTLLKPEDLPDRRGPPCWRR